MVLSLNFGTLYATHIHSKGAKRCDIPLEIVTSSPEVRLMGLVLINTQSAKLWRVAIVPMNGVLVSAG